MAPSDIYYLYDIGAKKNQEDYIWPAAGTASADDRIFIVCDGVGGSQNGEIASRIVAESVGNALLKMPANKINPTLINQQLAEAKTKLINYSSAHNLSVDMATTFSLLALIGSKAFIAWCGDSRVYHIQKGEINFKTQDHSLVNTLLQTGNITADEAQSHPHKNIILKAIRADETAPEAECHWIKKIEDGDYFLLCSDGLLENITERDIKFLLEQNDRGTIDLTQSFQKFCFNKTNDNYSMYLIKVNTKGEQLKKIKTRITLLLLLIVLSVGAFVLKRQYFDKQKESRIILPVNRPKLTTDTLDPVKMKDSRDNVPDTSGHNSNKH
jgi:PPM family protein phosphatase